MCSDCFIANLIAAYNFSLHDNSESTTSETNGLQNSTMTNVVTTTDTSKNNITTTNSSAESVTDFNNSQSSGQEAVSVEGLEEFTKTGDNQISVSPDNEFIKLIVEKKSVDSERLVAIYAVPDLGNNFVLEFDNKRDSDGNIIRSPKTLKRIYHINKERNITVATGKPTGNEGVDYGTSLMTYYLVTDVVMPEFPDYFTDVG